MSSLIFVYGTLKTGQPNHYLMMDNTVGICIPRGKAHTHEKFPLVIASRYNIPYLLYASGKGHHVEGELYHVDDKCLEQLDQLENHPHMYERRYVTVLATVDENSNDHIQTSAQAYFLVKYQPHLLNLPFIKCYEDAGYVRRKDREIQSPDWWYEINTAYEKCA